MYKLSKIEEEKKEEIKPKEIIISDVVPLKSRLLFEQEGNPQPTSTKILETNIDELMKNKIDLLNKKTLNEQERSNLKGYGCYFKFITMEEIEKGNYPNEKINYINSDNINDNNSNVNLNSDADFIMPSRGERLNNKSSRKST